MSLLALARIMIANLTWMAQRGADSMPRVNPDYYQHAGCYPTVATQRPVKIHTPTPAAHSAEHDAPVVVDMEVTSSPGMGAGVVDPAGL